MNLIYKGVDITENVKILTANIYDTAGGEADSVDLLLSDTENLWRTWGPEKGDLFEVKEKGFTSGAMYVYFAQDSTGKFTLKGRSTPPKSKTTNTMAWEKAGFTAFANDIAKKYNFSLEAYGISNWHYDRVDQVNEGDLKFLNDRCILESCCLKVHNKKIIIYSEPYMESLGPVLTLTWEDLIGEYSFSTGSEGLFSSCTVNYMDHTNKLISFKFEPDSAPEGPELKTNFRAANLAEAERFSKGWLRYSNKWETFASINIRLNLSVSAGNTIKITGMGAFSGKYFVHSCTQRLLGGTTSLKIRKVLEGY